MPPRDPRDPRDPWDPNAGSANSAEVTSAVTDVWGLDPDTAGSAITVDYGSRSPKRLDPYDTRIADASRAPSQSTYADLMANPMSLYQSDPKAFLTLQQAMFAAGFYGTTDPKSVQWGQYTDQTVSAWRKVLQSTLQAQSAGYNLTPEEILRRGISGAKAAGAGAGTGKPPKVIDYTDPAAIAGAVQSAAKTALGRNLSDAEVKHFVSEFRAAQTTAGDRAYAAQTAAPGTTVAAGQPDLSSRAEQYVKERHGTEIQGNEMADYVGVLESLLGG